jgi:hypothetical protein
MRASVLLLVLGLVVTATLPLAVHAAPSEDVGPAAPFLTEMPSRVRVAVSASFTEQLLFAARMVAAAADAPGVYYAPGRLPGGNASPLLPRQVVVLRL